MSYFLHQISAFIDLESSKSIACAIVSSRLDYANSCLYGISYYIHRQQRVQNCLAHVVKPTTLLLRRYLPPFTGCLSVTESHSSLLT